METHTNLDQVIGTAPIDEPTSPTIAQQRKLHQLENQKRFATLTFCTAVGIVVITLFLLVELFYLIATEQNAIVAAFLPYFTPLLSGIIGVAIGAMFMRGRN